MCSAYWKSFFDCAGGFSGGCARREYNTAKNAPYLPYRRGAFFLLYFSGIVIVGDFVFSLPLKVQYITVLHLAPPVRIMSRQILQYILVGYIGGSYKFEIADKNLNLRIVPAVLVAENHLIGISPYFGQNYNADIPLFYPFAFIFVRSDPDCVQPLHMYFLPLILY